MSNQGLGAVDRQVQRQQPIKKVIPQHPQTGVNAGQKPLHKIVLLPSQSLGHSRQNSSGSASIGGTSGGSLGTFQDSLNSFGLQNSAMQNVHPTGINNQKFFGKEITIQSNPQSTLQSARGQQSSSTGILSSAQLSVSASASSSTETLLKPGVPLQARVMMSVQNTAEKQKPVFFSHFQKATTDSGHNSSSKLQAQLYMQHQRSSSGSSSSGSSSRENRPPIQTSSSSQLIHIERGNAPYTVNYNHHSQQMSQVQHANAVGPSTANVQQMKLQKYNKIKNELSAQSQQKRISPINGAPPQPTSQQHVGKKSSKEFLTKTGETNDNRYMTTPNLSIAQSLLYQQLSGHAKCQSGSVPNCFSETATPQTFSHKQNASVAQPHFNKQATILKTSQMTKNLLLNQQNLQGQFSHNTQKEQKSQTLKVAVNNILNNKPTSQNQFGGGDLSARLVQKAHQINNQISKVVPPQQQPSRQLVNYGNGGSSQCSLPHDSLKSGSFQGPQHKAHQQSIQIIPNKFISGKNNNLSSALTSSKMMMALHKKCNSIVTPPLTNPQAFTLQKEIQENQTMDDEKQDTVRHNSKQHNNLVSSTSSVVLSMTTSQMSQQQPGEFFDENVLVNQVRQITPRGQVQEPQEKKAPQIMVQNFFELAKPGQVQKTNKLRTPILSGQVSASVQSPVNNPNKENIAFNIIKPEPVKVVQQSHKRTTSMVNSTDAEMQVEVVDKRRMSYENNHRVKNQVIVNSGQNSVERQTKQIEKTPPGQEQDLSVKLAKAHEEFSNRKLQKKNAKEEIVQSIGILLRQQKGLCVDQEVLEKDPTHKLTIQHLRDFLTYLEDKAIINCENLASNEQEMSNLINDLVKLDFNKFQAPPQHLQKVTQQTVSKQKRLSQDSQQNNRRASLDLIKDRQPSLLPPPEDNVPKMTGVQSHLMSPVNQKIIHPQTNEIKQMGLVKQDKDGERYLCFYSPINLNGNGNIINTNIQIYQPSQFNPNPVTTSQKTNYAGQKVFSQPVSSVQSSEKEPLINLAHDQIPKVKAPHFGQHNHSIQNPHVPSFQSGGSNQLIFIAPQQLGGNKRQHKRVYSIGSNHELVENQVPLVYTNQVGRAAVVQSQVPQNRMNFGFAGMPEFYQAGVKDNNQDGEVLFGDAEILELGIQKAQIDIDQTKVQQYHARKRSMFVQQASDNKEIMVLQPQYGKVLNAQHQRSQEFMIQNLDEGFQKPVLEEDGIIHRPNHRRAATNFVASTVCLQDEIRTLQPLGEQYFANKGLIDTLLYSDELREERDRLIAYIKHFTFSLKPEIPITSVEYYKFVKLIGKGAFGKVTLGIHKLTGKFVAIKTVDKTLMKDDYQKKKVLQEVQILKKVRHANVIRLLEVFESPKHLLMVMEYAGGGDLLQYVKKRRRLDESDARRIFKQIVFGIAHCHCRSVLHRDIKLDNILLDKDGDVKICDFGVSRVIQKHQKISEQCGTPAYIAPEIISDGGYQGFAADIWSLGVLLFAMVCGTVPFKAQSMHELHELIINGRYDYPTALQTQLSNEVKDLINRMLIVSPKNRISISEILKHPWIQLFDSILDENQEYQMDGDITLHSFDSQQALLQNKQTGDFIFKGPVHINELLSNVNVDNLYKEGLNAKQRLSYADYCSITQDHATMNLNEEVLHRMEGEMGIPKKLVKEHLNKGDLNHATATYQLIVLS